MMEWLATQSMHHCENIDAINHYVKQRRVLLANSTHTLSQSERKSIAETRRAKPHTYHQASNHLLKLYE